MTREEKEAERAKRDREMQEERREAARLRDERFAEVSKIKRPVLCDRCPTTDT